MTTQNIITLTRQRHRGQDIIRKPVTPDTFRYGLANHHLKQGTDSRYIQEWLGHESSKTTEVYTHVTNSNFMKFKNPLDDLFEDDS